jgi:predicted P-loop ATPase
MGNKMSINDLDEAIAKGFSIADIEATARPMEVEDPDSMQRAWGREGLGDLNMVIETVTESGDKEPINDLMHDENRIDQIAWAWIYSKDELREKLKQGTKIFGCKTPIRFLTRKIEARARRKEKEIRKKNLQKKKQYKPAKYRPCHKTLDMLERKQIKDKDGEFLRWGDPYALAINCETVFSNDPRWVGQIRKSQLDGWTHIGNEPITNTKETEMLHWLRRTYHFEINPTRFSQVIELIASKNEYHPVQDYLDGLMWTPEMGHKLKYFYRDYVPCENWDDKDAEIVDQYGEVPDYSDVGIPHDELPNIWMIYGIKLFLGLVVRAYEPGAKLDTATCWIGKQGMNKSKGVEFISPETSWWSDADFDLTKKDVNMILQGKWVVEIPECHSLSKVSFAATKAFISRRIARFRRPHARYVEEHPFSHCFIATTNEDRLLFLNDPTGSRRFWVIKLKYNINIDKLVADLDDLFAEAKYLYEHKCEHWLTNLEQEISTKCNNQFRAIDSWEYRIATWLKHNGTKLFTMHDVLENALDIPARFHRRQDQNRVADILKVIGAVKTKKRLHVGKTRHNQWQISEELLQEMEVDAMNPLDNKYRGNYK